MGNPFVEGEIDKIIKDSKFEYPMNMAMSAAWIMGNFKGNNLKIFDVRGKSSLTDFFIVGTATNKIQAQSMGEEMQAQLKRHNYTALSVEGMNDSDWILIDFKDVIVHVFVDSAREHYALDQLWQDVAQVEIPHSYYQTSGLDKIPGATQEESEKDYF